MKRLTPAERDKFFDALSVSSGNLSPDTVRSAYYAMIRLVNKELRTNDSYRLPDFIEFSVHKTRKINPLTKGNALIEVRTSLDYKIKEYVKKVRGNPLLK